MSNRINVCFKPVLLSLMMTIPPVVLTSCTTLLPSSSYENLVKLTESQNIFAVNAKSMDRKGLLAEGPATQRVTLNVSKKKIDKSKDITSDNLKWGLILIELPSYYGGTPFVRIEDKKELSQFHQSIDKFVSWSKLPYSQRESSKDSINSYLKTYGMGDSERKSYSKENFWYVMNDTETQEPLLILHKDYKRSVLPSNTIGFKADDLKVILNKVDTLFNEFDALNDQL
ncbi:hypothetical protein [Psychrobacter pygoscelis]|uniref:hypothetical protein n=1 Tax=Psychrobacter pygoscelis TaxID=2488563 RepID=UPI0010404C0C|nr:hypothetical protein [Psychrobacter pygoscelis]